MASRNPPITASQLPRLARCRASYRESIGKPSVSGPQAMLGQAAHRYLLDERRGGYDELDRAQITQLAAAHGVSDDELIAVVDEALPYFRALRKEWGDFRFERPVEPPGLGKSRLDLMAFRRSRMLILDYKSGQTPVDRADYNLQVLAYGRGAREALGWKGEIFVAVIQPSCEVGDIFPVTHEYLDESREVTQIVIEEAKGDRAGYVVGDYCKYCPGRVTCPAHREELELARELVDTPVINIADLTADELATAYDRSSKLKSAAESVNKALKSEIVRRGGIELEDGSRREPCVIRTKRLDTAKAWGIATKHVSPDRLPGIMTISLPKMIDAAKADKRDELGKKRLSSEETRAVEDGIASELSGANAVSYTESTRIFTRESKVTIEEGESK